MRSTRPPLASTGLIRPASPVGGDSQRRSLNSVQNMDMETILAMIAQQEKEEQEEKEGRGKGRARGKGGRAASKGKRGGK